MSRGGSALSREDELLKVSTTSLGRTLHVSNSTYSSLREMGPSYRIFKELAKSALEYHVLAQGGTLGFSTENHGNLYLHRVPASSAKIFALTAYHGVWLAKRYSINRVVAQDPVFGGVAALHSARLFRVPLIAELHTDVYFRYMTCGNPVLSAIGSVAGHILRNATRVRVLDRIQAQLLEDVGVDPARMILVPYRVDTDFFHPSAMDRESARRKFGYEEEDLVVISIGRFVEQKGYANLLSVFSRVARSRPTTRLVIVGGGPMEEKYREIICREGIEKIVRLLPWTSQEDLRALLRAADLYVQPSLAGKGDWMPRTILEAMAMELAVVASDVAGIPEVVRNDVTGIVVPAGQDEHLLSALIALSGDGHRRHAFGQEGRRRASSEYGWDDGFRRYREALQSLDREAASHA